MTWGLAKGAASLSHRVLTAAAWMVEGAAGGFLANLPSVLAAPLSIASVTQTAEAMCARAFFPNTCPLVSQGHLPWPCECPHRSHVFHLTPWAALVWCGEFPGVGLHHLSTYHVPQCPHCERAL